MEILLGRKKKHIYIILEKKDYISISIAKPSVDNNWEVHICHTIDSTDRLVN